MDNLGSDRAAIRILFTRSPCRDLRVSDRPDDRPIVADHRLDRRLRALTHNILQVRTLFVSGLPMDAKPRELYLLFRSYPGYESSLLKVTNKNGKTSSVSQCCARACLCGGGRMNGGLGTGLGRRRLLTELH